MVQIELVLLMDVFEFAVCNYFTLDNSIDKAIMGIIQWAMKEEVVDRGQLETFKFTLCRIDLA